MILASTTTLPLRIRGHLVVGSGLAASCFILALLWFSGERLFHIVRGWREKSRRRKARLERLVRRMKVQNVVGTPLELQVLLQDPASRKALEQIGSLGHGVASVQDAHAIAKEEEMRRREKTAASKLEKLYARSVKRVFSSPKRFLQQRRARHRERLTKELEELELELWRRGEMLRSNNANDGDGGGKVVGGGKVKVVARGRGTEKVEQGGEDAVDYQDTEPTTRSVGDRDLPEKDTAVSKAAGGPRKHPDRSASAAENGSAPRSRTNGEAAAGPVSSGPQKQAAEGEGEENEKTAAAPTTAEVKTSSTSSSQGAAGISPPRRRPSGTASFSVQKQEEKHRMLARQQSDNAGAGDVLRDKGGGTTYEITKGESETSLSQLPSPGV